MADPTAATPAAPERYITIHGHFYQPPRENPWLETVETQDSAAPYHDWNERITAECYAPNGASRIVNPENQIVRIINNYARISFNFGPTLLSWLEENASRAYQHILEADQRSRLRFAGHGSAMAQVYNHIIMPLANTRDRLTQIRWGIADFESRFRRKPEGMWLAETAADNETLELLAENGILFTVLAPSQCARVRSLDHPVADAAAQPGAQPLAAPAVSPLEPPARRRRKAEQGADKTPEKTTGKILETKADGLPEEAAEMSRARSWQETPNGSVDPTQPYLVRLKSGRSIAVFFYDGPRSRAIAFERLLDNGDGFANRLMGGFHADTPQPGAPPRAQLVHVATDGESYGHHHRYGEMALSWALKQIEQRGEARLTNYGQFLARFPPRSEAEIFENTSWSCFHGVERWRSDCGCNGGKPGWNQKWRGPLRDALDWLRDSIAPLAEQAAAGIFPDLWAARDAYISVVLARGEAAGGESALPFARADPFLEAQAGRSRDRPLDQAERILALKLMEMQRHALLMYTSCGWFFDDISGIETVQIIAYAGRVVQLAAEVFGAAAADLEAGFIERLRAAKSNDPQAVDGGEVYLRHVKRQQVGLEQVAAHYAISSVFTSYPEETRLFGYIVRRLDAEALSTGLGRLVLGRALVSSILTGELEPVTYAVLHFGDQNITAAIKGFRNGVNGDGPDLAEGATERREYDTLLGAVRAAVERADIPGVIRLFDRYFGDSDYSLTSLFNDEERRVLKIILEPTLLEIEKTFGAIFERHSSLLQFLSQAGLPNPAELTLAAGFSINSGLRHALEAHPIDSGRISLLLAQAKAFKIAVDEPLLGYLASQRMKKAMVALQSRRERVASLDQAIEIANVLQAFPFDVRMWHAQNIWYEILESPQATLALKPAELASWQAGFKVLGRYLGIAVEELVLEDDAAPAASEPARG